MSKTIKNTPYSIGYTDYSSKIKYNLNVATLKNRDGYWIAPTIESAKQGAKSANLNKEKDFYGMIIYPKGKKSYPLIATTYILLPDENKDTNEDTIKFFKWAFNHGGKIAESHGFAMLPRSTLKEIELYWKEI